MLHDTYQETKINRLKKFHFYTAKCGNFSFEFCSLSFFLYSLITNRARKLKVAESTLIMENFPTYLPVSVGVSCARFLVLVFSLSLSLYLSLSLTRLLMPHFC